MSVENLVTNIKRKGLLTSVHQLEELYKLAIENEQKLAESQREFRAADATIENLQMQVEKLVAENAGLKKYCEDAAFDADYESELLGERGGFVDGLSLIKTPATDAFLAEVWAQVEKLAAENAGLKSAVIERKNLSEEIRKAGRPPHTDFWHQSIYMADKKVDDALNSTPATDAFLAEVAFAAQLRKGVI